MTPERNLAVQTAVIARARAFVGTYGGYSYLAPFCGVRCAGVLFGAHVQGASPARRPACVRAAGRRHARAARRRRSAAGAPARSPVASSTILMKILFLMDSPEYLRFYDSAIEELASRGHVVSLAVSYGRERKPVGLDGLRAYEDRVRVLGVAPDHEGMWGDVARGLRGIMDFVRYLHPRFAAAPALRARMKRKILPSAYHWLDAIPRMPAGAVRAVERALMAADRSIPVCETMVAFLREQAPDVLLVSPLVAAGVRAGRLDQGRPRLRHPHRRVHRELGQPDEQGSAAHRARSRGGLERGAEARGRTNTTTFRRAKIATTGAQLFDRWFVKQVTRDRETFCARVGLPDTRPFLLFTGSSSFISRSNVEVPFVRRWIAAIRGADDPALRDVQHPRAAASVQLPGMGVRSARGPARRRRVPGAPVQPDRRGQPRRLLRLALPLARPSSASTRAP